MITLGTLIAPTQKKQAGRQAEWIMENSVSHLSADYKEGIEAGNKWKTDA